MNQLTNVYTYQQGVSDEAGVIQIASSDYETAWNYGSFSLDKGFNTEGTFQGNIAYESVQVVKIDEHPEIQTLPHLSLLKIDAEGFDLNVLKGAIQTIEKHKPVIFIEAHLHKSQDLIRHLNQLGYRCFWFISDRYQPNNHFGQQKTISGLDYNLACFHESQTPTLPTSLLANPDSLPDTLPLLSYN
ncbi:FkbM family methyltransferase [Muribacter muris]|uniref:FkbM family methyltransferase n=1 Tax=Muribacter muris TaxID=67855 RepID=UPI002ADE5658|nr:FkbM family methyltransferase [Muribacter muris]